MAGFDVAVCAPEGHRATLSRFVEQSILVPHPVSIESFLKALRLCFHQEQFAHCMVCDDDLLFILADRRSEPWVQALLPTPMSGNSLDFVLSKLVFPLVCQQRRMPIPATAVHVGADAIRVAAKLLEFPLIAKLARGSGGRQVFLLSDARALEDFLTQLPDDAPLALQPYVAGTPGSCCALWVRGELKAWFAFHTVSTWPDAFGPSTAIRLVHRPQLEPLLCDVGSISRFHGLGGIDFIERADGIVLLTEQHGRPVPQFVLAAEAGIDLSCALRALVLDDVKAPLQRPALGPSGEGVFPLFPQEAQRILSTGHPGDLRGWRNDPRCRAHLGRSDRPVYAATVRQLRRHLDPSRDGIVAVEGCYLTLGSGDAPASPVSGAMQAQLAVLGMAWVRQLVLPAQPAPLDAQPDALTAAERRCLTAHLRAIERAAPEVVTLILEANTRLSSLLPGLVRSVAMLALRQYDVVLLGCQPLLSTANLARLWDARQRHTDGVDVLTAKGLFLRGAVGYMVTPSGRRKLPLLLSMRAGESFDRVLARLIDQGQIHAAVLVPFLVTSKPADLTASQLTTNDPRVDAQAAAVRALFFADGEAGPQAEDFQRLQTLMGRVDGAL